MGNIKYNGPAIGLWTLPVNEVLRALERANMKMPDWMETDEDIVITDRADNNTITFIGRLVGEDT